MKDTAFVYCLEFPNGKRYIGVSCNPVRRYSEHRGSDSLCGHAFRKHGNPELKLLAKSTREYCMKLEAQLTDEWNTVTPNGYNLQRGGVGGSIPSLESREKMRKAQTGKRFDEETRKKMSLSQKSRPPISETTRELQRQAALKRGVPRSTIEAGAAANRGRPQTIEQRQAQSLRVKAWWASRRLEVSRARAD